MGIPISGYGMYLNDDELDELVDRISHDEQVDEDYGHVDCATDLYDMCDCQLLNHDNMWGGWRIRFLGDDMTRSVMTARSSLACSSSQ